MIAAAPAVWASRLVFCVQPLKASQQPCSRYSTGQVAGVEPAVQPGGSSSCTCTVVPTAGELIVTLRVRESTWLSAVTLAPSAATPGKVAAMVVAGLSGAAPAAVAVPAIRAVTRAAIAARRVMRIGIASSRR
jgi:hypothetical protein